MPCSTTEGVDSTGDPAGRAPLDRRLESGAILKLARERAGGILSPRLGSAPSLAAAAGEAQGRSSYTSHHSPHSSTARRQLCTSLACPSAPPRLFSFSPPSSSPSPSRPRVPCVCPTRSRRLSLHGLDASRRRPSESVSVPVPAHNLARLAHARPRSLRALPISASPAICIRSTASVFDPRPRHRQPVALRRPLRPTAAPSRVSQYHQPPRAKTAPPSRPKLACSSTAPDCHLASPQCLTPLRLAPRSPRLRPPLARRATTMAPRATPRPRRATCRRRRLLPS